MRKKTLKAEEAGPGGGAAGGGAKARRAAAAAAAAAANAEATGDAKKHGAKGRQGGATATTPSAGDKRRVSESSGGGGKNAWPLVSTAPAGPPSKPLWAPGKRPKAGRAGSHARSRVAAEGLVDACVAQGPLEGIAAAVLGSRRSGCRRCTCCCRFHGCIVV